jgi:DNA repair exonuclease SbcCD ATPase subunit
MSTWDDKPNDYEHALQMIEQLREQLMLQTERSDLVISNRNHWHAKCERLREQLEASESRFEDVWKHRTSLEIERLRAQLQKAEQRVEQLERDWL